MNVKRPISDDSTTRPLAGSDAVPRPSDHDGEQPLRLTGVQAGWSDDGKTAVVAFVDSAAPSAASVPQRQTPSPRLPWPARDQSSPAATGMPPDGATFVNSADDRTRLFKPHPSASTGAPPEIAQNAAEPGGAKADVAHDDPTVGWLVIVDGPGRGRSLELGIGANAIGREKTQKVCLRFGDLEVHRERHALVVFDPKSRRFFVQCGEVRNLTYINDEVVLNPVEIKGGETITVGGTHLRFVPFCGPNFGW
jgi:hypothetical protein